MMKRRTLLGGVAASVGALSAAATFAKTGSLLYTGISEGGAACQRPKGPKSDFFPNVVVRDQDGKKALFYDDLLRGKIVAVNFMSVRNDALYPVTENLAKVQALLGDRLGRDVFMYSITRDPEHDTPEVLKSFAEKHGAKQGWSFLTGSASDIHLIFRRFFSHSGHHASAAYAEDCSMGLVRYGNEALGTWASFPARLSPESIVKRFSWVQAKPHVAGAFHRAGPPPLKAPDQEA